MASTGRTLRSIATPLCALVTAAIVQPAAAAQDETVSAFVAWRGVGQALRTGSNETSFIGVIEGTVYVMTSEGPVDGGQMVCPASLRINGEDRSQSAVGSCNITARDGAQIFARLECTGVYLVGCSGDFVLTGGTEHFAGISGGGRFVIRRNAAQTVAITDKTVTETVAGVMFWPSLHYRVP